MREKFKVSFCDEADYLVSTFTVEAFSSYNAIQIAMLKVDHKLDIRSVFCVNVKDLEVSEQDYEPFCDPEDQYMEDTKLSE